MKKFLNVIKENKAFIFPWVALIGLLALLASGLTFAYFDYMTGESEGGSSMRMTAADLEVSLSLSSVNLNNMMPIYDDYKDTSANAFNFSMSNTSKRLAGCVDLYLGINSISEALVSPYFKYELKNNTTNTTTTGSFASVENNRLLLKANENITRGATYSYTLKIWYSYSDSVDQSDIMGASLSSKLISVAYGGACGSQDGTVYSTVGTTLFTATEDGYYRIETYNTNGDYASGEILLLDNEKLYFNVSNTSGTPTDVKCYYDEATRMCGTQGTQNASNSRIMYAYTDIDNSFISGYAGVNAPSYVNSSTEKSKNTIHPTGKFFLNGKMAFATANTTPKIVVTYLGKYKDRNTKLDGVRYIKNCTSGNSTNSINAWHEIQAIKNGVNLAYGKTVTGSVAQYSANYKYSYAVDGILHSININGTNYYARAAGSGTACLTVDLGKEYDLDEIAVWHVADGRTYNNEVTSVSANNSTWVDVITEQSPSTLDGKRVSAYELPDNSLYNALAKLADEGYAAKYTGVHNDTYGQTGTKDIYHIRTATENDATEASVLLQKINVKFAGFCWQMIRTTDTGGVKLIYNGEPDSNGYCLAHNSATTHTVISISDVQLDNTRSLAGNYQYADSYTYDLNTKMFTLTNPTQGNFSNTNLLGKYTCKGSSTTTTCANLFYVAEAHSEIASDAIFTIKYSISDVINSSIGSSVGYSYSTWGNYGLADIFNSGYKSGTFYNVLPSSVGTMGGTGNSEPPATGAIIGSDVVWNNGMYTLTVPSGEDINSSTTLDSNHHYTCNTTGITCESVRFYIRDENYNNYYYSKYILFKNGDTIETMIEKSLTENIYDSVLKREIEDWYSQNMTSYTSYLDQNAIFCDDREVVTNDVLTKTAPLNYRGSPSSVIYYPTVKGYKNLGCTRNSDKFSLNNNAAKINYPVGLATRPEINLINNLNVVVTGQTYYLMSERANYTRNMVYETTGTWDGISSNSVAGVRPVIVLKSGTEYIKGKGTLNDPYVIN